MDRYLKRDSSRPAGEEVRKRQRLQWGVRDPISIVAWNCNGLSVRLKCQEDRLAFLKFVSEHTPDVLCISEVRCAALASNPSAKKNDGSKRYRGKVGPADGDAVSKLLRSPEFHDYVSFFSLADWRYAGTAIFVRRTAVSKPAKIRYNLGRDLKPEEHADDGRVICLEWESLSILHTYSPNNGWTSDSFLRREKWDEAVKGFLKSYRDEGKMILWCGDLNVAPQDADLSHPDHYKKQKPSKKPDGSRAPLPPTEYVGQPGCTPAERKRFASILEEAGVVDLYRSVNGEAACTDAQGPHFTWRGGPGKHFARGMRIDHFVGSRGIRDRVVAAKILGHGSERVGFLGSDHCPILLELEAAATQSETADSVSGGADISAGQTVDNAT